MKPITRLLLATALCAALAACGNKGPLVLPEAPPSDLPVPGSAPSTAPAQVPPTQAPPPSEPTPPAPADPAAVPPVPPPAPADDGGNG
jgi:predicted small lipoprotein YifL